MGGLGRTSIPPEKDGEKGASEDEVDLPPFRLGLLSNGILGTLLN